MIDPKLLEILACPVTHQSLKEAPAELLTAMNAKVGSGGLKNIGGHAVEKEITAGLIREDGQVLYPIVDGIPVLLENEGVAMEPGQNPSS